MDCKGRQGYGPCLRLVAALRLAIPNPGRGGTEKPEETFPSPVLRGGEKGVGASPPLPQRGRGGRG